MAQHYYYVKVADHLRCEKAAGPREACKKAFGVVYDRPTDEARYKDIGTRVPRSLPAKAVAALQGPDGWLPIPRTGE